MNFMNPFWDWVGKTDPNYIIPLVVGLGTWLWHKSKGDNKTTWSGTINYIIDNLMHEWLPKYDPRTMDVQAFLDQVRPDIEKKVWNVMEKRGIPENAITEPLVHMAIERGTAWLGNEAAKLRIPIQLDEAYTRLKDAQDKLKTVPAVNITSGDGNPA